ncbi:hypothetical protein M1403_00090 [Patescibacteria group bacterium]|nr:hypothetical protein [Patescibacteria group bacterium]
MKFFIIIALVIAVAGGGFLVYKNQAHPALNKAAGTTNKSSQETVHKAVVDCGIYEKKPDYANMPADLRDLTKQTMEDPNNAFVAGDRGNLPADFPAVADQSKLCGSIRGFKATYYTTSLSDDDLFKSMTLKLKAYGCDTEAPQHGVSSKYLYYMNFTCPGAKGLVGTDPTRFAYAIIYPATSGDSN